MRKAAWVFVVAIVFFVTTGAFAQYGSDYEYSTPSNAGISEQLKTAQSHATFAAQAETMAGVKEHLAHVVNCLQGPRGANFNSSAGNPCQGEGNGIIPDLTTRGAAVAKSLASAREANTSALDALKLTAIAQAKTGATKVATLLGTALKDLPK